MWHVDLIGFGFSLIFPSILQRKGKLLQRSFLYKQINGKYKNYGCSIGKVMYSDSLQNMLHFGIMDKTYNSSHITPNINLYTISHGQVPQAPQSNLCRSILLVF